MDYSSRIDLFPNKEIQETNTIKKEPSLLDQRIPKDILETIFKNIESCFKARMRHEWGSFTCQINEKAFFFAYFDKETGKMKAIARSFLTGEETDRIITIKFLFESETEVKCDRKNLIEKLENSKKRISITAAKILLVMEKILSSLHTFKAEKLQNNKVSSNDFNYSGTLDIQKLKDALRDVTSEKFVQAWESIKDSDTEFLTNIAGIGIIEKRLKKSKIEDHSSRDLASMLATAREWEKTNGINK